MVSICIITKNESDKLKKCLERLEDCPFEIVVVDTGSTDNSMEIAKKYTDSVYFFEWCDDFAKARNYAASKAKNDIIMALDTDEYIKKADFDIVEKMSEEQAGKVGRIHRSNTYTTKGQDMISNEWINRIYDRRIFVYSGRIHEQIVYREKGEDVRTGKDEFYDTYKVPVYVEHVGYIGDEAERVKKADRNIRMLEQALYEDGKDPYILYQLGKGYYYKGDYENSAKYFEMMFDMELNPRLEYVIDMITTYGYSLINSGKKDKALMLENLCQDFKNSADYWFMLGLVYMQNELFEDSINAFKNAVGIRDSMVQGVNSYIAFYNIGVIYECLGDRENAIKYYAKCKDYDRAAEGLKRLGE